MAKHLKTAKFLKGKNKRFIIFVLTIVLAIAAVLLIIFHNQLNLDALKRYISYRKVSTDSSSQAELISHSGGDNISFSTLGDTYIVSSSTGIRLYSSNGTQFLERIVSMSAPVLTEGGSLAGVYDIGGNTIYLFDEKSEIGTVEENEIYSARLNANDYLAVTSNASSYKAAVTVYDKDQEKVITFNYSSAFVMDAIVSSNSNYVAVVTLGQEDNTYNTSLVVYSLTQEDPLQTVSLGNSLVLDMRFDDNTIWTVSESALTFTSLNGSQKTYDYSDFYLKDYCLDNTNFATVLIGKYRTGSSAQLVTVDKNGNSLGYLDINEPVLSMSSAGRYLAVLTADHLDIYTSDMTLYSTTTDLNGAKDVVMQEDGSCVLISSSTAQLYIPN